MWPKIILRLDVSLKLKGKIIEQDKLGGIFQLEIQRINLRSTDWFKAKGLLKPS
jgi:hypothetical protein